METTKLAVSINNAEQIGVPFTESYWKRTPKMWRIIGDGLMSLGALGAILGVKNPVFATICAVAGWAGKIITNSISTK